MTAGPIESIGVEALARLEAIPDLNVFDGIVPTDPPRDLAMKALPYAVLYMGGGRSFNDRHGAKPTNLAGGFQITCAAGTTRGCNWAVDVVRAAFIGKQLLVGLEHGLVREPVGYEPGPARRDDKVPADIRWYLPLQFRLATTTS